MNEGDEVWVLRILKILQDKFFLIDKQSILFYLDQIFNFEIDLVSNFLTLENDFKLN